MADEARDRSGENRSRRLRDRIGSATGSGGGGTEGDQSHQRPKAVYVVLALGFYFA